MSVSETTVREFCGFLTAELAELHNIHPQRVGEAWDRFKAIEGDGRG